ncbi:MAG: Ca-activated chloride channel, partial [Mycobacterium sp.]|nr:Ca-activated chloride channel [Mycobacterium sp.]
MSAQLLPLLSIDPVQPVRRSRPTCGELSTADGRTLPLKALSVDTVIVGMTATSTVRQRFVNAGDTTIEATYVFPLPNRAGVTDFAADLAGRHVIGVLKERGEARADYEQALLSGQRAAIVEEDRSDVFSVRVGNLGPGEEATIEMRLTGPLAFEDGEATFRFPLVVAPRYTAGRALSGDQTGAGQTADTDAVPDASRVAPPRLVEDDERPDLQISLSLDAAGLAVSDLRSSLPTAVADAEGLTRLQVEPGARADRDFVLRFRIDRSELSSSALLVPDADGDQGTWSVTLVPPSETSSAPRDVVVVLDRSGSMNGWKMIAARRAAGRIVDMLDTADRFCVLAFDDRVETPTQLTGNPGGLVSGSDRNRFAAASWLGSLESRGGTAMAEPLQRALDIVAGSGEDRQVSVVLVTDGQVTGEDHLLRALAPVVGRTRIYCVGIDRAVNAGFLDRLAQLGSGRSELVESEERLDEAMARLARTIGRPALTGIRVSAEGVEIIDGSVTPNRLPDAFAGVPCAISGRYLGRADSVALRVDAD